MTHRENAEAISAAAGIKDGGRTAEAFTRLFTRRERSGWNGLTQADFAMVEDAFADATGRPRRKRKNPLRWEIGFWWYWHVTSPLIHPVTNVPGNAWRCFYWHAWRKRHGGIAYFAYRGPDGESYLGSTLWTEYHAEKRALAEQARADRWGSWRALVWDKLAWTKITPTAHLYPGWSCRPCHIVAGLGCDGFAGSGEANDFFTRHLAQCHGGLAPEGAGIEEWVAYSRW